MHYGPGFSYYSPEFTPPCIMVEDGVVETLRFRRKRLWLEALSRAVEMWRPVVDIQVKVVLVDPRAFVGLGEPDWPQVSSEVAGFSAPGHITFVRSTYTPPPPKFWPMSWAYAYASFYNVPRILKQTDPFYALDRLICHEIGHNLGLAHGGNGIMSGGSAPNAHDLDSVRTYYA